MKLSRKPYAGKPHVGFEAAGAGNVMMELRIEGQSESNGIKPTEPLD